MVDSPFRPLSSALEKNDSQGVHDAHADDLGFQSCNHGACLLSRTKETLT